MKHSCVVSLILSCAWFLFAIDISIAQTPAQLHPLNQKLAQLYPRGFEMPFPDVPRLSAAQALQLYQNPQAVFFHIGDEGPDIIGSVRLSEINGQTLDVRKLIKLVGSRYAIAYCY